MFKSLICIEMPAIRIITHAHGEGEKNPVFIGFSPGMYTLHCTRINTHTRADTRAALSNLKLHLPFEWLLREQAQITNLVRGS